MHSEDLRNTTMGAKSPEFTEEEVVSEHVFESESAPADVHEDRHLHPTSLGIVRGSAPQARAATAVAAPQAAVGADTRQLRLKIAEARLKGYEGDPCGGCGAFTLVRNGTCLKCVSCGATSGCS